LPIRSDGRDERVRVVEVASTQFADIDVVFDATSAGAHRANAPKLTPYGKKLVDLTPAARLEAALMRSCPAAVQAAHHTSWPARDYAWVTCRLRLVRPAGRPTRRCRLRPRCRPT
jgi:acetaldehyde dehydrogenase (acetylating)